MIASTLLLSKNQVTVWLPFWLSFILAFAFWFAASWVDTLFFSHEPWVKNLRPAGMDLYMRLLVFLQIIGFGYLASRHVETSKRLNSNIAPRPDEEGRPDSLLKENEFLCKFAIEGSGDGIWDWNIQTGEKKYSKRWKEILGYAESDILPTGEDWENRFHPDDGQHVAETMQAYLEGREAVYTVECRIKCKDNSYKWILGRGMVVSRDEDGKPLRMVGTNTDISFRKEAEAELRIAAAAFEAQVGMMITDAHSVVLRINSAFTETTGYTAEEIVGQTPRLLKSGRHDTAFYAAMWDTIKRTGSWQGEVWDRRKNGEIYPKWLAITAVKSGDGTVTHYVGTQTDISVRKAAEDAIKNMAFYDPLTQLPNRRLLNDRLGQAMAASKRSGCYGALVFLDLDDFKPLNDTHGHVVGDSLLIEAADRLNKCVREMDTVARFGGDEFVVMLKELGVDKDESISQARIVAEKIRLALSEPYRLTIKHEGKADATVEHLCTASIGVALFINQEASQGDILKRADAAMYQAKEAGRNKIRFYGSKA